MKLTMNKLLKILLPLSLLMLFACGGDDPVNPGVVTPATPTGITLNRYTDHSLIFQWNAVEGAQSYAWRLLQNGSEVQTGTTRNTVAIIDGLTKGVEYSFYVRSVAGEENSAWSSEVTGVPGGEVTPPTPPGPDPGTHYEHYEKFLIPAAEEDGVARSFPGAEGGGMYTTGGRGGRVIRVTNLNDSGEGSLRAALTASGARIVVFAVSGIIELQSKIQINNGNLTVAGQTAPGDGICVKNYTINVNADNVIFRFMRFRLGDEGPNAGDSEDCIWGRYHSNIVLDHCSMSWSIDECASFYANSAMTMQWCIIAESLQKTIHSKGEHGYGGIWGGKNASFHHNLLAHHQNRTPRFDHQYLYDGNNVSTETYRGNVDYRNCVNYNWGSSNGCYGGEGGHFNLVNNYYKAGPNSNDKPYFIEADGGYSTKIDDVTQYFPYDWAYLFLSGNYSTQYPEGSSKYPGGIYWKKAYSDYSLSYDGHALTSPLSISGADGKAVYTTTHSAADALEIVCKYGGASLRSDAVDVRICKEVKDRTGAIVNDIDDVKAKYGSAWPSYNATSEELARCTDTDLDGIPDWFEDSFSLDKTSNADALLKTLDKNGRYDNIEMYLHYLVKDIVAGQTVGGAYTRL